MSARGRPERESLSPQGEGSPDRARGRPERESLSPGTRVIALGQPAAGDDGVGFAVLEELRRRGPLTDVELIAARDSTALISLLETTAAVVVVDAALGGTPGQVIDLSPAALATQRVLPVSSHGIGVAEAIALARQLAPGRVAASIRIVAVTIERPGRYRHELSPGVAAAARAAADRIVDLVRS